MLYKEASKILLTVAEKKGSVKNLVLGSKYKNKKQLYALVCETVKYKAILTSIIESTKLQRHEKILRQDGLAQVLLYDFLLGKGFHGPSDLFKDAILKHKAALLSELARLKVKAKATKNEDLLPSDIKNEATLPRYVRVNTLITTVDDVIEHFRRDGLHQMSVTDHYDSYLATVRSLKKKQFLQDPHIPELLICAPGTDLHNHVLYNNGSIIFQDKASCLPAYILDPSPGSHVIDCCAAPGNKTSHIAAILRNKGKIYAFDKDEKRVATMNTMLLRAGVLCADIKHGDFLQTDPKDPKYKDVKYILVDPSCSGSGIVNRLNDATDDKESSSAARLQNLAKFQVEILSHALTFPNVVRVVYSTCSTHSVENEGVVSEALRVLDNHYKLVPVLKNLPNRGQQLPGAESTFKARRCLRMSPGGDLTNGFFVACFEKKMDVCADLVQVRRANLSKSMEHKARNDANVQNPVAKTNLNHKPTSIKQKAKTSKVSEKIHVQNKVAPKKDVKHLKHSKTTSSKKTAKSVHITSSKEMAVPSSGQIVLQSVSNRAKAKKKRPQNRKHKPIA